MDVYRIGVALTMTSNAGQVLSTLSQQLLHVHGHVNNLQGALSRVGIAMGGALAAAGGVAVLKTMGHAIDRGNDLVKLQQDMAQAGVKNTEIQEAYAKSWELTGKYQNMSAGEVMRMINDGRMTFGSQHDATHHSEDFVQMASFLKSYQDGKHAKGAEGLLGEVNAAMKSGEIAGKITPEEMKEHVKQLTAMKVAYGEQLKVQQYLTAQRNAGVALRNTSDEFRYGMFPALVQENGQGAGTMLMTAFNKIVAGTGNRTKSVEHMMDLGLLNKEDVQYDKNGRVKGLKNADAIKGSRDAAMNFGSWVMTTLKPLLDAKTKDPNTGQIDHIKEAQMISAMFPDRNAAKAITEVLQQFTKFSKDAALMKEAHDALNMQAYNATSWIAQKQAFTTQWDNLIAALGAPMVGRATEMLRGINQTFAGLAQWAGAKENADTIRAIGIGIAGLGAGLVGAGATAILAALGPAGWLVLGIGALGGALLSLKSLLGDKPDKDSGLPDFAPQNQAGVGIDWSAVWQSIQGMDAKAGEMMGSLATSAIEGLKAKAATIDWSAVWPTIKAGNDSMGDYMGEVATKVRAALAVASDQISTDVGAFATIALAKFSEMGSEAKEALSGAFGRLKDSVLSGDLMAGLGARLRAAFASAQDVAASAFSGIGDRIRGALASVPDNVGPALIGLGERIRSALADVPGSVGSALLGLGERIRSALSGIPESVGPALLSLGERIQSALAGIPAVVQSALSGLGEGVRSALSGLAEIATSALSGIGERIRSTLEGVPQAAVSAMAGIGESVRSAIAEVPASVAASLSGLSEQIRGVLQSLPMEVTTAVSAMGTAFSSAIQGLPGQVSAAISAAVQGIANLISNALSGLPGAVSAAIGGIGAKISSALGGLVGGGAKPASPGAPAAPSSGGGASPAAPAAPAKQSSLVPPPRSSAPIQVASTIMMNERAVGRAVTRHQVAEADTRNGTQSFDDNVLKTPVGYSAPMVA